MLLAVLFVLMVALFCALLWFGFCEFWVLVCCYFCGVLLLMNLWMGYCRLVLL